MENSKIEWTDHTVNFVIGCTKVSEACANCYAEGLDARYKWGGQKNWGKNAPRYLRVEKAKAECLALNRKAAKAGRIDKVFINSLSDTFEGREDLSPARAALCDAIEACQSLTFLLLTKRPENMVRMVPESWSRGWPENVIAMTTVDNQPAADLRIPHLLKVPARRGLSCEPLLGPVDLRRAYPDDLAVCSSCGHFGECDGIRQCAECGSRDENPDNGDCAKCDKGTMRDICPKCEEANDSDCYEHPSMFLEEYTKLPGIHWVIAGGESGPKARPMHPDWARSLRDQCAAAGVAFHFKQWGEWAPQCAQYPQNETEHEEAEKMGNHGDIALEPSGEIAQFQPVSNRAWLMSRVGKKAAGRLLDGRTHDEFPNL